ncbi:MAG: hypothetical protein JSW65_01080 [Candidatus Bipolaricaulota bacterium]|nr:MAG: hypothetical protein JSW65_01080 [Candidatus Bipolaricaulota bacterium]
MFQPIHEPVDALVTFTTSGRYPILEAFRWRRQRYDITGIESVRRCTPSPSSPAEEPRSYGHFSSRWTRGSEFARRVGGASRSSLCYRVRAGTDRFELQLDPKDSRWMLEGVLIESDEDPV